MTCLKLLSLAALLAAGVSSAQAAADFITVTRSQQNLDDATPRLLLNFTLPDNLNRSSQTSNSAVLTFEALGVEFNYNEAYINPPTTVCTANDTDANQPGSLGFLREHDDDHLKTEWAANQIAFSSAQLVAGNNQLMVCIRNLTGGAGSGVGNLDNVSLKSIVLHYHINP